MRQDYLHSLSRNTSHTSLLDWSLQNSKTEPPFQLKNNEQWELLGEIDVAAQSPKPQHTTTTTTPVLRPRRHRCISDDTESHPEEEPQHDSNEREFHDLKPKSLDAFFESSNTNDTSYDYSLGEIPIPSLDEPLQGLKRSRDCLEESYCYQEEQEEQCRQSPPRRKRRRVAGRNNALCAQDYNEIFSQLGC